MTEALFPRIVTNVNGQDQAVDLLSYQLIHNRTVYISGEISDMAALNITSQLAFLSDCSDDDVTLIINSPGGAVSSGMAIYDMIRHGIRCDVITVAVGLAASMGAFLLASGTKGKRYAVPNAEIMIHQPLGGASGQATDITLVAEHIQAVKQRQAELLARMCGKNVDVLMRDMERDRWMTAHEALEYGIVDWVGFP